MYNVYTPVLFIHEDYIIIIYMYKYILFTRHFILLANKYISSPLLSTVQMNDYLMLEWLPQKYNEFPPSQFRYIRV